MALHKRTLTVNFQRAVTGDGPPVVMEVAVNPLEDPTGTEATVIGRETQDVLVDVGVTSVTFDLVPTDHPDLVKRIPYRIGWREKYMGRQYSSDFVMPDFNVDFDDLQDLGAILGGESYVQWTDVGVAGGVAGLNLAGQVVDAEGNPVSGADAAAVVQGNLDAEAVARQEGDNFLRVYFLQFASDQITQVYASTASSLAAAVAQLENADTTEHAQRVQAVAQLNTALTNLQNSTNADIANLNELVDDVEEILGVKADLVGGKIPSSQLPDIALGKAVTVASQAAMLALTTSQVQPGDFAVRPDGVWFLNANPPSVLGNWVQFQVAATVMSVNGYTGAVVLSAADIGARSASVPVPQADVFGLPTALSNKVDVSVVNAINARLQAIENDTTIVRTVSGVIPHALHGNDVAFLNEDLQIVTKSGTVVNLGGGGGELDIADVTGLQAALDAKVDDGDPALTNARTPTSHASSHASAGSDPITPASIGARASADPIPIIDITGLGAILTDNALTSSSNHDGRLSSLESRVEDLELGGGGGGGSGASGKTVWYSDVAPIDPLNTATDSIELRSPFGHNGTNYYYDPAGADPAEAVWPYLTPNGHLKFIARNEAAPADDPLATQDALDMLADLVDLKASQSDLDTTNAAVATKASNAALSALDAEVDTKASSADLSTLTGVVATKATTAALDALSDVVDTKADQDDHLALVAAVDDKASNAVVEVIENDVTALQTGKADVAHTHVIANITGLQAALDGKAASSHTHTIGNVTGLQPALDAKADLVGGLVPTSQLPSLAFTSVYAVANRPAMLALTTAQVQPGDVAVITATADKGSYILNATDPSVFTNWVRLQAPDDLVQSVNGQSGTVVLNAANVGARSASDKITYADLDTTSVQNVIEAKANTADVNLGLATKTTPADVQTLITKGGNKVMVDFVASSNIALAGPVSVDGVVTQAGHRVLCTAQASSINNGIYEVRIGVGAANNWVRVADMATGDFFSTGVLVVTGPNGTNHKNSVWQQTNASGLVGTNANNWTKVFTVTPPPAYTAVNGVQLIGTQFSAKVVAGGGLQAVAGGLQVDVSQVPKKFAGVVPSGSTVATITHNLGTKDVTVAVRDISGGDLNEDAVLVGWKPINTNQVSLEFEVAPTSNKYRAVVIG